MSTHPRAVGPYRILDTIGIGGMGVVYRGEHCTTGEIAAIKTVRVPMRAQLSGLRREIHALVRLSHPGIVRVLDEGIHQGLPWYAMERLDGASLRDCVPGRHSTDHGATPSTNLTDDPASTTGDGSTAAPAPPAPDEGSLVRALTLVRRLCQPLAYLHGEGLVHRDLKPENVLVVGERPVIVDFGIAARFAGAVSREPLELVPKVAGTMAYMAPEQIEADLVDARADLYALGCILYELVAGHPPFIGNAAQIALAHLTRTPAPLSETVEGATPELDALVLRLLAKRPSDRFGYADDVAAVLAHLGAEGDPEEGPRPHPYLYRPGFAGRRVAITTVEARIAGLKRREARDRPPRRAGRRRDRGRYACDLPAARGAQRVPEPAVRGQPVLRRGVSAGRGRGGAPAPNGVGHAAGRRDGRCVRRSRLRAPAAPGIAARAPRAPPRRPSRHRGRARVGRGGPRSRGRASRRGTRRRPRRRRPPGPRQRARPAPDSRGGACRAAPLLPRQDSRARLCRARRRASRGRASLGGGRRARPRVAEAREVFERGLEMARAAGARTEAAQLLANLAIVLHDQSYPAEARALYLEVLEIYRETGNLRFEGIVIGNLGEYYIVRGEPDEARAWFTRALPIVRECGDRVAEANLLFSLARLEGDGGALRRRALSSIAA